MARILHWQGKSVAGSDQFRSPITEQLKQLGIQIEIGQPQAKHVPKNTELVIHSVAVPEDHPELVAAQKMGAVSLTYPQALSELTEGKKLITVSGTHGKTTTTALVGKLLADAGFDPTVIVGSLVPDFEGNARLGKSDYYVIEADEYGRAFLHYQPTIAIVTNIEADHLDVYKDIKDIKETFGKFLKNVDKDGCIIANAESKSVSEVVKGSPVSVVTYGLNKGEYHAEDMSLGSKTQFVESHIGKVNLGIPGKHNVENALATIACGFVLGIKPGVIRRTLTNFQGTWRRFEQVGLFKDKPVISDYAHHPTEIIATLETARQVFSGKKILTVFQPHHHNRTKKLFKEFVKSFDQTDGLIISEIYDVIGREELADQSVTSQQLVDEIDARNQQVDYAKDLDDALKLTKEKSKDFDVIIIMGAGTIDEVARQLTTKK